MVNHDEKCLNLSKISENSPAFRIHFPYAAISFIVIKIIINEISSKIYLKLNYMINSWATPLTYSRFLIQVDWVLNIYRFEFGFIGKILSPLKLKMWSKSAIRVINKTISKRILQLPNLKSKPFVTDSLRGYIFQLNVYTQKRIVMNFIKLQRNRIADRIINI